MDQFYYHNLFETKGIEYIITIFFFLLLIPFGILLNRKVAIKEKLVAAESFLDDTVLSQLPKGLFFGRNHTWAFLEKTGNARVGINHLLMNLTGQTEVIFSAAAGDRLSRGDLMATIVNGKRKLNVLAPVTGIVKQNNSEIEKETQVLQGDPYGKGWLTELEPSDWQAETQQLMFGSRAVKWVSSELERIRTFMITSSRQFADPEFQMVMQDGGEVSAQALDALPELTWNEFQKQFMNEV